WYVFHDPQRRAQIAGALRHARTSWVLIGWLCYSTVEVLATVRWQILLRIQGIRLSWLQAGGIVMIGLFFSQFLPGGVGGDAMRLYFAFQLAPRRKMGAALSIAMDRLFGLLTVVFLAGMSFIVRFSWLTRSGTSRHIAYLALILLSASLAFVVLIFWLANFGLLHRLPKAVPLRKAIVESGRSAASLSRASFGDGAYFSYYHRGASGVLHELLLCRRSTAHLRKSCRKSRGHSFDHAARGHNHLGAHFAWRPWGARDSFSRVAWQSRAC